jgi:hypothetical protein
MTIDLAAQPLRPRPLMEQSPQSEVSALSNPVSRGHDLIVKHFRQIVLWPLQLMPIHEDLPVQKHCDFLQSHEFNNLWRVVEDEFTGDPSQFQERHYSEFIIFLPSVQRFLYGEGTGRGPEINQELPIRVFRRSDMAKVRMTYPDAKTLPIIFDWWHTSICICSTISTSSFWPWRSLQTTFR